MAEWSARQVIPVGGFSDFGFTAIGKDAFLIGGWDESYGVPMNTPNRHVYRYDSILNQWSFMGDISATIYRIFAAVSIENYIYCFGFDIGTSLVSVYLYRPYEYPAYWEKLGTTSYSVSIIQNSFVAVGNKIYNFGTSYLDRPENKPQSIIFDISTKQWSKFVSPPHPLAYYGLASYGNKIYIFGGEQAPISKREETNIVYELDVNTGLWNELSSMITGKTLFMSTIALSEIYAISGTIYPTAQSVRGVDDTQIFNISTNLWRYGASFPYHLYDVGNATTCNYIIVATDGYDYYTYDTRTATITNPSPTSGFVNEKVANAFSWTLQSNPAGMAQNSAMFQWRVRGASTINTINVGTTQSVTVPANILPNGEFEWRVSATNTAGIETPFTDWFLLTTIDPKPNKPTGLYPNTGSRDGTKVIQFSWLHNSPLSTPQLAFELQITYDGGTTWKVLSGKVTTANTQFNAAANTIIPTDLTGRLGWRVRTYNSDDVASDWSDTAFFIVHPAPQIPNWISVEAGRARPLCRWTSVMQVGFQLQILLGESVIFDSGEIHGTHTEYRIPQFLNNGVYNFRIRIKNIRGLYSAWANRSVSINARQSLNITLRGEPVDGGAALDFDVEVRA